LIVGRTAADDLLHREGGATLLADLGIGTSVVATRGIDV